MAVNESNQALSPNIGSPTQNGIKHSSSHKPMNEVSNHVGGEHKSESGSAKDPNKVSSKHHKSSHDKPKENSSSSHKSSKHSSSSGDHKSKEHKHQSSKEKSHSSTKDGSSKLSHSPHKHSSSGSDSKSKSKSSSSKTKEGEKSHHKEHKDKPKVELDTKNGLKMVIKPKSSSGGSGSGEHHSSTSKHKDDKHKDKHSDKHKSSHSSPSSSSKSKHKSDHHKSSDSSPEKNHHVVVKTERESLQKSVSPVKTTHKESPSKVKSEELSDDDVPLFERQAAIIPKREVKEEIDESDEEPLASRVEKKKKVIKKRKSSSDDDDYDDDDDEDYSMSKPSKKKVKKEPESKNKKPAQVKRKPGSAPVKDSGSPTKKKKKTDDDEDVWKWWEDEKLDEGTKWRTLSHNGPVFAPPYEPLPSSVKFLYDGKHVKLSPTAEEVAGFYARMLEHDYVTKDAFNKNFFKDWKKTMTSEERALITDLKKCNFKNMLEYFKVKSEERKAMTKEEKLKIKLENEKLVEKYGFCIIDGHKQKVGNFKIEPPGLFRGRGEHPKMGMLKRRTMPEDVIINIGKEAAKPKPPEGHKWKEVRHDNTVTWLATWTENILGQNKYIMLNPSSKLKGEKDFKKYEMARKLKTRAEAIRKDYKEDWKSKEMKTRQRAVALYFIDKLALRAGNEKDEGETADTVGCCSLRVEHITLDDKKEGKEFVVSFDFLGKDSIRYTNSVPVEKRVYKNLKLFMENKQPSDELFDRLNTAILNKYLNDLMEGLTAKVFRTFNASKTLQEQLDLLTKEEMSIPERLLAYNRANRAVAILCNHQRAVPKTFDKQMENLNKKIEEKEDQINDIKNEIKKLKKDNSSNGRAMLDKKKKRLQTLEDQLQKLEVQQTDKEENKQIALSTSKLNYLDPRISVAWCKKWEVPIEKIYNRTQRDKFRWAIEMAGPDYKF